MAHSHLRGKGSKWREGQRHNGSRIDDRHRTDIPPNVAGALANAKGIYTCSKQARSGTSRTISAGPATPSSGSRKDALRTRPGRPGAIKVFVLPVETAA